MSHVTYPIEDLLRTVPVLTGYDEVREVMRNPRMLSSGGRPISAQSFLRSTLLVIDGEPHRDRRRLYVRFSRPDYVGVIEKQVTETFLPLALERSKVRRLDDGSWLVDLVRLGTWVTTQVAAAIIGLDIESPERLARLIDLEPPLAEAIKLEWIEIPMEQAVMEGRAAEEEYWRDFVAPAFERRLARVAESSGGDGSPDILSLLAARLGRDAGELPLRDAIQWLAAITGNLPAQIAFLFEELWGWFEAHPEDRASLADDGFLAHAIIETLRLHITGSPVFLREAAEEVTLESNELTIRAGDRVALSLRDANCDESVFGPDARGFDPHRPARLPREVRPYGVAFGDGQHTCPGKQLVLGPIVSMPTVGLEMTLAKALVALDVRPVPGESPRRVPSGAQSYLYFPAAARH